MEEGEQINENSFRKTNPNCHFGERRNPESFTGSRKLAAGSCFTKRTQTSRISCLSCQKSFLRNEPILAGSKKTGEGGIRTPGTRKGTLVFETSSISRSDTSPVSPDAFSPRGNGNTLPPKACFCKRIAPPVSHVRFYQSESQTLERGYRPVVNALQPSMPGGYGLYQVGEGKRANPFGKLRASRGNVRTHSTSLRAGRANETAKKKAGLSVKNKRNLFSVKYL
jgi:hypothetical protein